MSTACVHTSAVERVRIGLAEPTEKELQAMKAAGLEVHHVVYSPSVLPLEMFTKNLLAGRYKESFKKIDLTYKPSNTNNKILTELIDDGFLPVYISIRNTGTEPFFLDNGSFQISNGKEQFPSIPSDQIPSSFKRFNTEAVAANIYNVTIVTAAVIGSVGLLVAVHANDRAGGGTSKYNGPFAPERTLNPVDKTTLIDYEKFLFKAHRIEPNEVVSGLIFFKVDSKVEREQLQLLVAQNN